MELEPFPSRSTLHTRHKAHLERFLADWKEREQLKAECSSPPAQSVSVPVVTLPRQRKQLLWECGTIVNPGKLIFLLHYSCTSLCRLFYTYCCLDM